MNEQLGNHGITNGETPGWINPTGNSSFRHSADYNDVFRVAMRKQGLKQGPCMTDGHALVRVPDTWLQVKTDGLAPQIVSYGVRPAESESVLLCIFFSGRKIVNPVPLLSVLRESRHRLMQSELAEIREVLREKSLENHFKIMLAKTEEINGQNVLSIDGMYTKHQYMSTVKYIQSPRDPRIISEVSYTTLTKDYFRYLVEAQSCFDSIVSL